MDFVSNPFIGKPQGDIHEEGSNGISTHKSIVKTGNPCIYSKYRRQTLRKQPEKPKYSTKTLSLQVQFFQI